MSAEKFAPYREYRESGVEWLGRIPTEWDLWKLSHAFDDIGSGTTPPSDSSEWYGGDIPWITTGELREREIFETTKTVTTSALIKFPTLRVYPRGSVAIAMYGATIGRLGVLGVEATTNQACCVLPDSIVVSNTFLYYWFQAFRGEIVNLASGGGQPNISQSVVSSLRISAPEPQEQAQIAKFLDYETLRIDALIEKQQRLIALLKEKRQAVISHAVTKGLNPDAPMRDSGVEWLGEVPAHWDVAPLMRLTPDDRQIMYGIVLPGPDVDSGVPIVKGGDVKPGRLSIARLCKTTAAIESKYVRSRLRGGDIVYSIRGSIGDAELVPAELTNANITQDAARISPLPGICRKWLLFAMRSNGVFRQLEATASGATIRGINIFRLKRAQVPVPSPDEQEAIADWLEAQMLTFDSLQAKAEEAVELLQERRTALISAAVTGKIDVRGWKAPEPQTEAVVA